jgi:type VI secretion system secreted protein Hcp
MKIKSIKGEVTSKEYIDALSINSVQFGAGVGVSMTPGNIKSRTASTVSISEVVCTKQLDQSSTALFSNACQGSNLGTVTLHFTMSTTNDKAGDNEYLLVTLDNVIISGYSASSGGDRPSESISLNFTKITMKYLTQDDGGKLGVQAPEVSWDLATNSGT